MEINNKKTLLIRLKELFNIKIKFITRTLFTVSTILCISFIIYGILQYNSSKDSNNYNLTILFITATFLFLIYNFIYSALKDQTENLKYFIDLSEKILISINNKTIEKNSFKQLKILIEDFNLLKENRSIINFNELKTRNEHYERMFKENCLLILKNFGSEENVKIYFEDFQDFENIIKDSNTDFSEDLMFGSIKNVMDNVEKFTPKNKECFKSVDFKKFIKDIEKLEEKVEFKSFPKFDMLYKNKMFINNFTESCYYNENRMNPDFFISFINELPEEDIDEEIGRILYIFILNKYKKEQYKLFKNN